MSIRAYPLDPRDISAKTNVNIVPIVKPNKCQSAEIVTGLFTPDCGIV